MIAADYITPTLPDLIPTGEIMSVADTAYDFRTPRPVGAPQLLQRRTSYDVNYVLRGDAGNCPMRQRSHRCETASRWNCGRRSPACNSTTAT